MSELTSKKLVRSLGERCRRRRNDCRRHYPDPAKLQKPTDSYAKRTVCGIPALSGWTLVHRTPEVELGLEELAPAQPAIRMEYKKTSSK